jgi:hypothetical protein
MFCSFTFAVPLQTQFGLSEEDKARIREYTEAMQPIVNKVVNCLPLFAALTKQDEPTWRMLNMGSPVMNKQEEPSRRLLNMVCFSQIGCD